MEQGTLSQLLKLPAGDRAELAMALWESLSGAEREESLALTDEQAAELDRRWKEHLADPGSAVPWSEVQRRLLRQE
ncbi:MAG TPA: addiction module protein [Acidobacteriota bacterium]|nr:addiction module protein [Acidobacteriota bacterium]